MIFYRSPAADTGKGPALGTVRTLTAIALTAYPLGAAVRVVGPDSLAPQLFGFGLILVSLAAAAPVFGSYVQRIIAEQPSRLDEFELQLRQRAMSKAYALFTGLALLAVLYAGIATDADLWVPSDFDGFNGLFWGGFLYATLLPTACLAWSGDANGLLDG